MSEQHWYREVEVSEVPRDVALVAAEALAIACMDLELTGIRLRWFVPVPAQLAVATRRVTVMRKAIEDAALSDEWRAEHDDGLFRVDDDVSGVVRFRWTGADPSVIWVRADRNARVAIVTVAHEVRHLWQLRRFRPPTTIEDLEAMEKDAHSYERHFRLRPPVMQRECGHYWRQTVDSERLADAE
jgi:hypothetical protein